MAWRVVSADSHPVSGGLSFSVGAPSASVVAEAPRASRAVGILDGVCRWLAFAGLALALGGSFLLLRVWPEGGRSRRARRLLASGFGALLVGTIGLLLLQGPYATAGSLVDVFDRASLDFTLSTRFGRALAARVVLTAALAALVARALRGRPLLVPTAVGAVAVAATWTLSDHSSTGVQTWLGIPAATLHLLATALWLGGLVFVLACVLPEAGDQRAPVLRRFSRTAFVVFAALAASGLYLAWRQVGTLAALTATQFGWLLVAKSAIVAAIVALAAVSRAAVRRTAFHRLRFSASGEVALGVAVLAVTAVLVDAVPARIAYAPPLSVEVPGPPGSALEGGAVQVKVKPAKEGENVADIYFVGGDGFLVAASHVSGRLTAPDEPTRPRRVEVAAAEPGHYVASRLSVPYRGRWILRLDVDGARVDAPLRIR